MVQAWEQQFLLMVLKSRKENYAKHGNLEMTMIQVRPSRQSLTRDLFLNSYLYHVASREKRPPWNAVIFHLASP